MPDLPSILRAEADRLGLSQSELASRSGLSQQAVSALFRGDRDPSGKTLAAILRGLGKPWGWLDKQGLDPRQS